MRIGINLLFLEPGRVGGSEIFAREILNKLDNNLAEEDRVFVYCTRTYLNTVNYKNIICRSYIPNANNRVFRLLFEIFVLPLILMRDRIDVLHSMGYTSPLLTHCKKVVTVFDTQFKTVPNTVSFLNRLIYLVLMPLIIRVNDIVITSSIFSKKEIVGNLGGSVQKIKVIYGAVSAYLPVLMFNKKRDYIMSSSATHQHKNVDVVVKAFDLLHKKYNHKELELFIAGFASSGHKKVLGVIKKTGLEEKIHFLGWIGRRKHYNLLRLAKVFVFPSSYEGFGLPPLEAMAAGTPVVSSDKGSLKEVLGGAAIIVEPRDYRKIAFEIDDILRNRRKYHKFVKKGIERAKLFDWNKTYLEIIKVYRSLYAVE